MSTTTANVGGNGHDPDAINALLLEATEVEHEPEFGQRLPKFGAGAENTSADPTNSHASVKIGAAKKRRKVAGAPEPKEDCVSRKNAGVEGDGKPLARSLDPATEADAMLDDTRADGVLSLRFWGGSFWQYSDGRYAERPISEVRARTIEHINPNYSHLATRTTGDVLDQIKAKSILPAEVRAPAWLGDGQGWKPEDVLVARNALVHLPSIGGECLRKPTPRFFSTTALDYDFRPKQPPAKHWLAFLDELWPDDQQTIGMLQEWFGYCLTPDTRQQKILALFGPKRSGKGTIGRILRATIGADNVAGPTLASFATNFGLWPLLGKSLAIVSDARLSGRTDQAVVVERLLSISGEDALTIDRKNLEPVTCKLSARLMILSNELPRLGDSSGALTGRMIILRLTESFYGREDVELTERLLGELPGVLLWAIEGWRRLRARGHFVQPESGSEFIAEMEELGSPIGAFVHECCEVGPEGRSAIGDLYARWKRWCETKGRREPGNEQTFGRDLLATVPGLRRVRPTEDGKRVRAYDGICIIN